MAIRISNLIALAPLAMLASCTQAPAALSHGTPQQFMANDVQPTAQIYWDSVGAVSELVDGEPVFREFQPETDEDWAKVRQAAVDLRGFGEVLASPEYSEGRGEAWLDFAQGLQDVSRLAEQTAVDKDVEAMFEVGGNLYNVCSACHQAYPAEAPEPGATPAATETAVNG
jgi:hypothetical protein